LALAQTKFGLVRSLALPWKNFMHPEDDHVGRHKPASGVQISLGEPTIVFVTVCSEKRVPWIAQFQVHELLKQVWTEADAWLVGYYQLMPDHLHLFAAPGSGLLWWGERPREPGLMQFAAEIGSPVVSPHQFGSK